MQLKPLSVAASLLAVTATSKAFLIPPEVSANDIEISNALAFAKQADASADTTKTVNLECPGCSLLVRGKGHHMVYMKGVANHLEMNFAIDHQTDADRLLVNGFELYPVPDLFHEILWAPQYADDEKDVTEAIKKKLKHHGKHDGDDEDEHHHRKSRRHWHKEHRHDKLRQHLGFSLQTLPAIKNQDGQLELIELDLQIIEVAGDFVNGIPNLRIKLVKTSGSDDEPSKLWIASVDKTDSQTNKQQENAPSPLDGQEEECATMMCKWLAIMKDKFSKFKPGTGCHKPAFFAPGGMSKGIGETEQTEAPQMEEPSRPPFPHHRYHHRHSWGQLFRNIVSHILLPVAIGIIAGVSVSL